MAMKRCPVCGERYSDTYKNCPFCEEEEYWEEEQQDTRRPILREGTRSPGRGGKSPYSIVTPILIVLIVLMAALLVYLLYGSKIADKFSKDSGGDQPGVQTPKDPDPTPSGAVNPGDTDPGDTDPDGSGDSGSTTGPDDETPGDGEMPEGNGGDSGNAGTTSSGGSSGGGMSYASAAALPSGLTLSSTDFTRKVSEGDVKLRVSGGTGSYTWISEKPSIATVSSDGTVTPVAAGTTNVVVTDGTKRAICIVRVTGSGSGTSTPSTTTPSTTTTTPSSGGSLKTGKAVVINGGNGVRVRSGPGTEHEALATIPNGGSVQIVEDAGNGWYKVTFTASGGVNTTGYMKGEFLSNS